jgi:hypothetical protein
MKQTLKCTYQDCIPTPFRAHQFHLRFPSLRNSLKVIDVNGRLVATVADKIFDEDQNEVTWNASDVNDGIYFLRVETGDYSATEKMSVYKE